jgi:hypothetical protein
MKKAIFFLFFNTFLTFLYAQEQNIIRFENPSFELYNPKGDDILWRTFNGLNILAINKDEVKVVKKHWSYCGFGDYSPPDIQPGWFEVKTKAHHGKTYIGMVIRNDTTWEGISQKLSVPLYKDSCYTFSAYLYHAPKLISQNIKLKKETNYNAPCILRIWGGMDDCKSEELLYTTPPITTEKWTKYQFQFQLKKDITHVFFEAYYSTNAIENGNLMMDNLSEIEIIPCSLK